jgi:hypothetical protein
MFKKCTQIHVDQLVQVDRCEINDENGQRTVYELHHGQEVTVIRFQKGSPSLDGVNGVTNEALIAVLLDRLKSVQAVLPCLENEGALEGLNVAMRSLRARAERLSTQSS